MNSHVTETIAGVFGLGGPELVVVLIIGLALAAVPLVLVMAILIVGRKASPAGTAAPTQVAPQRKCPECAEYVKVEARVCKHCGHRF